MSRSVGHTSPETESEAESEQMVGRHRLSEKGWWRRLRCWTMLGSYSPALSPPCDRFNLVYLCMIMAGAGFLFPWSSYITAVDYFFFLYWSDFHQVSVAIPMAYLVSTSLFTVVTVTIANHTSCHSRIGFGYVIFFFALLAVPLIDVAVHSCALPVKAAFYLTILTVLAVGVGSGVQQSSYYGVAGMLPPRYAQAVMAGESVAGVVVTINRVVTKLSTSDERTGAIAFFIISLLFIVCCVGCQLYIRASPFVQYYTARCVKKGKEGEEEEDREEEVNRVVRLRALGALGSEGEQDELISSKAVSCTLAKIRDGLILRLSITKEVWKLVVAVSSSFLITLLVFPGLVSEVQYCQFGDWTPIILVGVFSVTDFIAKWLALLPVHWRPTWLMVASLLRIILFPPILLLVSPSPSHPTIHPGTMGWAVFFVCLLGLSNGYFGSLPMIVFSRQVSQPDRREMAGLILTMFLMLGLTAGSVLAYVLTPLTTLQPYTTCSTNSTELFNACTGNTSAA